MNSGRVKKAAVRMTELIAALVQVCGLLIQKNEVPAFFWWKPLKRPKNIFLIILFV